MSATVHRSLAWAEPGSPLVPSALRSQWAGVAVESRLATCFDIHGLTWDLLDAEIWIQLEANNSGSIERRLVAAVTRQLARDGSDVLQARLFNEAWPPSTEPGQMPFRTRTANLIKREGLESDRAALQNLTVGTVLGWKGAGVVTLLDLACTAEATIDLAHSTTLILDNEQSSDWEAIVLPDPRFARLLFCESSGSLMDLARDGRVRLPGGSSQGIAAESKRVSQLPFTESICDYLQAVVPRWDEDRVTGLSMRLGFDDDRRPTLEETAALLGITRERVRQLEKKLLNELSLWSARPYLPKLDKAIDLLLTESPIEFQKATLKLAHLDSKPLGPAQVLRAANLLGRSDVLSSISIGGAQIVVPAEAAPLFEHAPAVLKHAWRLEKRYGAGNLPQLQMELEAEGLDIEEPQLALLLDAAPTAYLDDEGWFWFDVRGSNNSFVSTSRKMLSVNSPLSISCLREGLRRRSAFRQRYVVPPKSVMRRLYDHGADFVFDSEGDGYVRLAQPTNPEDELGGAQLVMVQILQNAPHGILDRETLMERCHAAGLNMSTAGLYTTYDPCIEHVAPNVWAARGTLVSPAVLEVFIDANGSRESPAHATGWTDQGQPWMAFTIRAGLLASPAVPMPKELKALLVGRRFIAQTTEGLDCGHISTDAGGSFIYGWSVFMRTMGVDVGDVVRSTFDLLEGIATLELGGSELIDR